MCIKSREQAPGELSITEAGPKGATRRAARLATTTNTSYHEQVERALAGHQDGQTTGSGASTSTATSTSTPASTCTATSTLCSGTSTGSANAVTLFWHTVFMRFPTMFSFDEVFSVPRCDLPYTHHKMLRMLFKLISVVRTNERQDALVVRPEKGSAVIFFPMSTSGEADSRAWHAGTAVKAPGKWALASCAPRRGVWCAWVVWVCGVCGVVGVVPSIGAAVFLGRAASLPNTLCSIDVAQNLC